MIKFLTPIQNQLKTILEKKGALSRDQLVQITNRARTTIFDNLEKLEQRGLVKKFSRKVNARGCPVVYWKIEEEN